MGAAAAAVLECRRALGRTASSSSGGVIVGQTVVTHPGAATLVAAALTALPLAVRRLYPITAWLVDRRRHLRPAPRPSCRRSRFATAVFAAYSAVVHSRYRNLAIGAVLVVTLAVTATFADTLPRFPGRLTALFAIIPAVAAGLGIRELRRRLQRLRGAATPRHRRSTRPRPGAPSKPSGPASPANCTTW